MTREELKVHCEKQIKECEMWAKHKGEEPSGKVYEEHKLILELLEQEPFINKPCVSNGVCEHDKNKVLNKIRAEISNHLQIMDICDVKKVNGVIVQSESVDRKVVLYDSVMQIIDKYRTESEE